VAELSGKYSSLAEAVSAQLGERARLLNRPDLGLGYEVEPADLLDCCRVLRDSEGLAFDMLMDLCGVD